MIRNLIMLVGTYIHGKFVGIDHSSLGYNTFSNMSIKSQGLVIQRSIYGFVQFIATLISIWFMPVSISVSIQMTTVFFTAILAFILTGERLSWRESCTIISGFAGVLILTN